MKHLKRNKRYQVHQRKFVFFFSVLCNKLWFSLTSAKMYIELEIALFPDFLKYTSSNWLIKKKEKKIISTGIKDKKTIPQAITENILWYEVKVMLESNYTDLSLWFVNEWTFFFFNKFSVFLWRALKVGKSASVGNVYFHLKNRLKDMF